MLEGGHSCAATPSVETALLGIPGSSITNLAACASIVMPPLPPGCLSTIWGDDKRFVSTYFTLFQEPLVSLNPALSIGLQMAEGLKLHLKL